MSQDQTVKVAEAKDLELELQRLKDENAELKKRLNESSSLESAKRKAESRVEQLEQRVSHIVFRFMLMISEVPSRWTTSYRRR